MYAAQHTPRREGEAKEGEAKEVLAAVNWCDDCEEEEETPWRATDAAAAEAAAEAATGRDRRRRAICTECGTSWVKTSSHLDSLSWGCSLGFKGLRLTEYGSGHTDERSQSGV